MHRHRRCGPTVALVVALTAGVCAACTGDSTGSRARVTSPDARLTDAEWDHGASIQRDTDGVVFQPDVVIPGGGGAPANRAARMSRWACQPAETPSICSTRLRRELSLRWARMSRPVPVDSPTRGSVSRPHYNGRLSRRSSIAGNGTSSNKETKTHGQSLPSCRRAEIYGWRHWQALSITRFLSTAIVIVRMRS